MKRTTLLCFLLFCLLFAMSARLCSQKVVMRDSIIHLLEQSKKYNQDGDFISAEDKAGKAWDVFVKYKVQKNTVTFDSLRYELLNALAWNKILLKKNIEAKRIYESLLNDTVTTPLPDKYLSDIFMRLSSMYGMQKDYQESERLALISFRYAQQAQDNEALFHVQSNLGDIYFEEGRYDEALAMYLEVRRLSVLLKKHEAISLANLGMVDDKLGKKNIAKQYYIEALNLSKEKQPVVYSIILPTYCEFLIGKGEKQLARELIMEAIKDSRYTQMSEYNLKFLQLLSQTYPTYTGVKIVLGLLFSLLVGVLLFLIIQNAKRKKQIQNLLETICIQEESIAELKIMPCTHSSEEIDVAGTFVPDNKNMLTLIGLAESMPQLFKCLCNIRNRCDNKTEILASLKEIEGILSPLNDENIDKELAVYITHSNLEFYQKLQNLHPEINVSDLRLCTLIKLGLITKEIAILTNKSPRGIESAKFRLRKKLDIDTSIDIYDYLSGIDMP